MANFPADFSIKLSLIVVFSILPSFVYLLISNKAKQRWQNQLRRAQVIAPHYGVRRNSFAEEMGHYGLRERRRANTKYFIGDSSCINNARSPYIRCAINPTGPCNDCGHYEKHQT